MSLQGPHALLNENENEIFVFSYEISCERVFDLSIRRKSIKLPFP
jgi:hypothetical protein